MIRNYFIHTWAYGDIEYELYETSKGWNIDRVEDGDLYTIWDTTADRTGEEMMGIANSVIRSDLTQRIAHLQAEIDEMLELRDILDEEK